jgi:HEAT repeat protein
MPGRRLAPLLLAGLLLPWQDAPAGGADRGADERRLGEAGLVADGPALLDFFRRRTARITPDDLRRLIEQLGDPAFAVRERATEQLTALGGLALPALARAAADPDPEVRRRAEQCRHHIATARDGPLVRAAARRLAARNPDGAATVLLDYLPARADEPTLEALRTALAAVAVRDGRPEPALLRALADESPVRRAAAGVALCRAGAREHLPAVRRLLQDAEPRVRLHVGLALADLGEKQAVPVLIALLDVLPRDLLAPAEDLLYALAGAKAPALAMGDDAASRRKFRDAWADWWDRDGPTADLRGARATPYLDHTLVLLLEKGQMVELDADDRPVGEMTGLGFPLDLQVLPGGRVLVAENSDNRVVERHPDGTVLWTKNVSGPLVAQRLADGHTFIATPAELLEVDRAGTVVFSYARPDGEPFMRAAKLPDGDIACVVGRVPAPRHFVRLDASGREKSRFAVNVQTSGGRIDVLPDGRVLVPEWVGNRVVEYDAAGKEGRAFFVREPIMALRLANGNTLVTSYSQQRALELDPAGKEVWQFHSEAARVNRAWRR